MAEYFDRYELVREEGEVGILPYAEIPSQSSDFYEVYHKGKTRLDQLSYDYYGDSNYAWLILQANPSLGSMEFDIKDNAQLRIPYPLASALDGYRDSIKNHKKYYD